MHHFFSRVQNILLKPGTTWPEIEAEPATLSSIYRNYLLLLAAIPALAGFIGLSLIGVGVFGVNVRVPLVSGLVNMVVGYVLSLVMVWVLALVVDGLAPTFGGTRNPLNAFKLVAFGSTAGFVGGIFTLLPALSMLGLLAALYSIYLLYTGLPVLMKSPRERATAYTAVVVVCGIVAGALLAVVSSLLTPGPLGGLGAAGADAGNVTFKLPGSDISLDTRKMDEMARKLEKAQASGDPSAVAQAATEALGAVVGSGGKPFSAEELKALLPEKLDGLKRESLETQAGAAVGMAGTFVSARYVGDGKSLEVAVNDYGGGAAIMAAAAWANVTRDRETAGEVEKIYKKGGRTFSENYRKDGSSAEAMVLLENGVTVESRGEGLAIGPVRASLESLPLDRIAQLKRKPA